MYIAKIVVSMIPVGIVGFFFKDYVESLFGSGLMVVGGALLLTSVLLAFAYYAKPRVRSVISFRDAFIIGLPRHVPLFPDFRVRGLRLQRGYSWVIIRKM